MTAGQSTARARLALATLLTLAIAATIWAVGASSSSGLFRPSCQDPKARLLDANQSVRVFRRASRVYACHRSSRRPANLGIEGTDSDYHVRNLRLAGRFAAYEESCSCRDGTRYFVFVEDVRRRRAHLVAPTAPLTPEQMRMTGALDGVGPTRDIELKSNGSVAWIVDDLTNQPRLLEVRVADASGRRVLERAADIEPGSLASSGGRLYWTSGGVAKSSEFR